MTFSKTVRSRVLALFVGVVAITALAADTQISSLQDYTKLLPLWGVSWAPGQSAVNGYYPSFYTGFAMRSEFPSRIHVQLSRGNQTRVSVILDDQTVKDYTFDLATRYNFYRSVVKGQVITPVGDVKGASALPQLEYFQQILESSQYGILAFVQGAQSGSASEAEMYQKGLSLLQALNPGRVFMIRLDLRQEFLKWREMVRQNGAPSGEGKLVLAINQLVFGRVNFTEKPDADMLTATSQLADLAQSQDTESFVAAAVSLFKQATLGKYDFKVLDESGNWAPAIQCESSASCWLVYPEFTAIYPTGSVMASTSDERGNKIHTFATPGLWQFLSRGNAHDVDNIRNEPFYGWAPKMDYEAIGNGFHNPAVRFASVPSAVKETLGIPQDHSTLWSVKRGDVSHGCSRLPLGHVWEMRHIFPVENTKMTQISYFGNMPQDFDLYDIDGDGSPEVMGVSYFISYGLQGADGLATREGADLEINADKRLDFYTDLYGSRGVFEASKDGQLLFLNPTVSVHSYTDFQKKKVASRLTFPGKYPLYEQAYEQDKVQFYITDNMSSLTQKGKSPRAKRIVRLLGRVRGCAPDANKDVCGAKAFQDEKTELLPKL